MDAGSRKRPAPVAEKPAAAKAARLGEEPTATAYARATLIEEDGKTAAHEVAWPEGREGSDAPPTPRSGPAAKEYPFMLDPFQRCAINCLETGVHCLPASRRDILGGGVEQTGRVATPAVVLHGIQVPHTYSLQARAGTCRALGAGSCAHVGRQNRYCAVLLRHGLEVRLQAGR